jgi:Carboxypeptidase regulatory-like domain/TonB-dependent Receptor Plug Domain
MSFWRWVVLVLGSNLLFAVPGWSQAAGSITGVVKDPSGAVVVNAQVEISNPVSGFRRQAVTGTDGAFRFPNLPFASYHTVVTAPGFATYVQDAKVASSVPVTLDVSLAIGAAATSVTVQAGAEDLIQPEPSPARSINENLIEKLPLESQSSSVSSLVTLASPGVVADSNGMFHGMGDHAQNGFWVDGQPITDQQSKVFSNQIPVNAIQSLQVISGAPPAQYGDKTSLIMKVTTRSGLGQTTLTGDVSTSYGSFGTEEGVFDFSYGGTKWGNFFSATGLGSGRFLDTPEFQILNDKGNEQNFFDRVDFQVSSADTIHTNFGYTRSWFQTPNSYDQQYHSCPPAAVVTTLGIICDSTATFIVNPLTGTPLGPTDQRSLIKTFNIAPNWTHLFGTTGLFTLGGFARRDHYNYFPSGNPFNDYAPGTPGVAGQGETVAQDRTLLNAGAHAEFSYVKGIHNIQVGAVLQHWFLNEDDQLGIVDPNVSNSFGCPGPDPVCTIDLTTGGSPLVFHGHTDIKEISFYAEDTISKGSWTFNLGARGDLYRGFTSSSLAEPRLGISYNVRPTNTVLRISYARTMETPFNENLILTSTGGPGGPNGIIAEVLGTPAPIPPGKRNDFHAGLEQAFGKYLVVDFDYMWEYTSPVYDFSILFNSPITFPIGWQKSKITGFDGRVSFPNFHGVTAYTTFTSVAARFFNPQIAGLGTDLSTTGVFRIDHDQKFESTTHIQYQPRPNWPWLGFNWRYDNGLTAGNAPFAPTATSPVDVSYLTPDQQYEGGLFCGSVFATPTTPISPDSTCSNTLFGSTLVRIPAAGTENDDHNPPRIAPRNLFDVAIGDDNLFHTDRYKWSLQLTAINLTNKVALYNFLSTFIGTHYVTPRTLTAQLGFHF